MSSNLTFSFMGDVPEYIELGNRYRGPKNRKRAEYNSGDGWEMCPEGIIGVDNNNNITLHTYGNQISFRGDWRDGSGGYSSMFEYVFSIARGFRDVIMSGTLEHDANNVPHGYDSLFRGCSSIIYMRDNPIPKLKGVLTQGMLRNAFYAMTSLTSLPEGFMDMSEMYGEPEDSSLSGTCTIMGISSPHIFKLGPDIKFTPHNIPYALQGAWAKMENWTGTVLWGDEILFNKIVPDKRVGAVYECPNMIGYDKIHKNWKE